MEKDAHQRIPIDPHLHHDIGMSDLYRLVTIQKEIVEGGAVWPDAFAEFDEVASLLERCGCDQLTSGFFVHGRLSE